MKEEMERYSPTKQEVIQEEEEVEPMEYIPEAEDKKEESPAPKVALSKGQDKGYIGRLENRLRELAGRLHELESYKLLCERKILELIPGHPLPLKASHLGKGMPKTSHELNALRQKVDKLTAENRQLRLAASKKTGAVPEYPQEELKTYQSRIESLEREKAALEESLRGEMLVSEEQRNYIEILKEALEGKIEDLGLGELLRQTEGKDISEAFAKLVVTKKELEEKRKELAKGESDIADMEGLIVDLKKQTDEQKEQLESVHYEYSKAIKDKEDMMSSFNELTQKVDKLQKDNDALLDYAEEAEEYKKNTEIQIAELREKCAKLETDVMEKSAVMEREKSKAEVYSQENEKLEMSWRKQKREKEREIATLGQTVEQFKGDLAKQAEQYRKKIADLEEEIERKDIETKRLEKDLEEKTRQIGDVSADREKTTDELSTLLTP